MAELSSAQLLVAILGAAAAGTGVFFHAERNRIAHPSVWASFVFLFLLVGLPAYVIKAWRVRRARRAGDSSDSPY
jgi:hypothetical protein